MDHKQLLLHELLQQDQEPFYLHTYISDKRSQLNSSSSQLTRRTSPDVGKPPFLHFLSPAISPCSRSPCAGAFLHVPSRTAAVLVEAAMRIQKQRQSKPKAQIMNVGLSLFGSFLKILKHRSKNRVLTNYDLAEKENSDEIRISCSCNRLCIDDLGASTTTFRPQISHEIEDFELQEARSCSGLMSPFRFSLHKKSPSSSARRTPEFLSPATSPIRRVNQEKENCEEVEEQCSPVSVFDSLFEDESVVGVEDDDDDEERSYANIERARRKLLDRLGRFEKLASLDPVELEQKLVGHCKEEGVETTASSSCLMKQRVVSPRLISSIVKSDGLEEWEWERSVVEETAAEMEDAILGRLMEELSDDLF